MKRLLKRTLRSLGFEIRRGSPHGLTGYDLAIDLREVIKRESPFCFDIGANEGQTIRFLQSVFETPTIHAFEPASKTFESLVSNDFGPLVHFHRLACGARCEEAKLYNYPRSVLNSLLEIERHEDNRFREESLQSVELVQSVTLDSFVAHHAIHRIDLLKIDTQGYDLQVLQGTTCSLESRRIGSVLIELNNVPMYKDQGAFWEIHRFLATHNLFLVDYYEKVRQGYTLAWCSGLFALRQ